MRANHLERRSRFDQLPPCARCFRASRESRCRKNAPRMNPEDGRTVWPNLARSLRADALASGPRGIGPQDRRRPECGAAWLRGARAVKPRPRRPAPAARLPMTAEPPPRAVRSARWRQAMLHAAASLAWAKQDHLNFWVALRTGAVPGVRACTLHRRAACTHPTHGPVAGSSTTRSTRLYRLPWQRLARA